MQPMLTVGVGIEDEDPDEVLRRCLQTAVGLAATAIGAERGVAGGEGS
jgi:hypothetical protein